MSGVEALDCLHETDVALRDYFGDRQAIAPIAHSDFGYQPQMTGDELMRGIAVAVLAPALGQHVFFTRLQHREPPDFLEISSKSAFRGDDR